MCANIVKKNNDIHNLKRNPLHDKAGEARKRIRNEYKARKEDRRRQATRPGTRRGENTARIRREYGETRQEYGKNTERIQNEYKDRKEDKRRQGQERRPGRQEDTRPQE